VGFLIYVFPQVLLKQPQAEVESNAKRRSSCVVLIELLFAKSNKSAISVMFEEFIVHPLFVKISPFSTLCKKLL